jgi:iron(III) transport system ATP-binding protein
MILLGPQRINPQFWLNGASAMTAKPSQRNSVIAADTARLPAEQGSFHDSDVSALVSDPKASSTRKLVVANLNKSFGSTAILKDISFDIEEGEFVCFLGPSGCGKTTLLLCLAGLESPDSGEIYKNGQVITMAPPSQRDVGIVFQSYALFPNLSVYDNIAFGLVNLKWAKDKIREAVGGLVSMLSLEGHENKYPSQLSGGQQQRVALARALAVSPSLLLLDEPLSALDAQVRTRLRGEIRDLQQRLKITTVMVTHDQEEAQTLADRIVLMNAGRIEQIGTPWQIYNEPATPFVADFMGVSNLIQGVVSAQDEVACDQFALRCNTHHHPVGTKVQLLLRPEDIAVVARKNMPEHSSVNLLQATIVKVEHLGAVVRAHVVNPNGLRLKVDISKRDFDSALYGVSQALSLMITTNDIRLFVQ